MATARTTSADPDDAGMLDVVGFDTATPNLISEFARGLGRSLAPAAATDEET